MPSTPASSSEYIQQLRRARTPRRPQKMADTYNYGYDSGPQPPGGFSYGTTVFGGPLFTDPFNARRAPSPWQLVEKYKSIAFAIVARKRDAVAKVPLRLFADGSRKVLGGKPRGYCDPIAVPRSVAKDHVRANNVSPGAVDNVYEVRNHPLLTVLDEPDPYGGFSREKLLGLLSSYMDVVGQAFLVPEGNGWDWTGKTASAKKGPPQYLWVLYSQFVIPFRQAGSNIVDFWQYFRDRVPRDSALWFRQSISLRDPYGSAYSPLYAGDVYADQEDRFIAIYDQVLGLGPRPSMLATAKDPMQPPGEAERKRLEQDMNRRHAAGNAGGLLVSTGAFDFTPMSYSPADLAGLQLSEYDRNNLACVFGVPPTFFTTDTNLANLEAADAQFARFAVEPMCKAIAGTLTRMARMFDPRLYFQFDPVLAEDELKKAQTDKIYVDMGAVTLNEITEEMKFEPKPWGDVPLVSKNLVPIDKLIEQADMAIKQADAGIKQTETAIDSQKKRDDFELQDEPGGSEERALLARRRQLWEQIQRRVAV